LIKHINPCGEWNDDVHDCEFRHYAIEYGSQLIKAKEIIKYLLSFIQKENYKTRWDINITEAEQFLKEDSIYERIQKAKYNYVD
jgi:hypothetical protein